MSAKIELAMPINQETLERAFRAANLARVNRMDGMARQGLRAARARDPKLLLSLEKGATILRDMSEDQFGKSGMRLGGTAGNVDATEYQAWRNAYTVLTDAMDDEAREAATEPYNWIYAIAGILAGIIV